MSMLSSQAKALRSWADQLSEREDEFGVVVRSLVADLREAADTIEGLRQKVEDLEGMLGELPPEGKCAMLLVKQADGEYIWGCELYDFASYCLMDSEADTYTGMTLNDPFGRADFADKLTMAKELRKMASRLDAQGDVLGIMPNDGTRWHELFGTPERAAKTVSAMCSHGIWSCDGCPLFDEGVEHCESELGDTPSLLEWLRGDA